MASEYIYRVIVKTTGSLQPGKGKTFWSRDCIYCGPSLRDARIAYLREESQDCGGSYGNCRRETIIEQHPAEPDDIATTEWDVIQ